METSIGCSVIIHNEENRVLICQRSASKRCFPLMWELPGGGLEPGESPEQCIRREAMEEIGCRLDGLKLLDAGIIYDKDRYVGIVYTATTADQIHFNEEIKQIKWISKDEINQYEFMTDGAERLRKYFSSL